MLKPHRQPYSHIPSTCLTMCFPRDFSIECGHVTLNHCHSMEIQADSNDQPMTAQLIRQQSNPWKWAANRPRSRSASQATR